jgi:dTDP-4-dehydrorhamnose reductase
LLKVFAAVCPNIVVNCVGIVKQLTEVEHPSKVMSLNSLLPHRLAKLCAVAEARLIHFSTDCVFSGVRGMYNESDLADAADLYGRSKLKGEVNYRSAITLRTSIIGHELSSNRSLVGWFLAQEGSVKGFRRAVFSGLPTVEIARIIHQHLLPRPDIWGLYHLSADPISKFELLSLIAKVYSKKITIIPDDTLLVDRSLDSSCFRSATGFSPKSWIELIQTMHDFG